MRKSPLAASPGGWGRPGAWALRKIRAACFAPRRAAPRASPGLGRGTRQGTGPRPDAANLDGNLLVAGPRRRAASEGPAAAAAA